MENMGTFLKSINEVAISKRATPEFYLLYQQSVLLSLREQGVLNEVEFSLCMDSLAGQFCKIPGTGELPSYEESDPLP